MSPDAATRAAEAAARASYGRLLALLAARTRDIAAAEDALADAFVAALRAWPAQGVPDNPDAWLLTVARNAHRNEIRHRTVAQAAEIDLMVLTDVFAPEPDPLPDERLKLLFVCAHPAIAADVRSPLMLQTVLGLNAVQIGAAFLVPPATMGQRLVRAKAKIRDAGVRFEVPSLQEMPERLVDVLDAIYAAYGHGWGDPGEQAGASAHPLTEEAVFLGRLLVGLMPDQPEPKGLLALMLYGESRRAARRDAQGCFVPLDEQDPRLWSRDLIVEAEQLLTLAARAQTFGRYQCEAAIQSVHAQRPITGRTNHEALATLYGLLLARSPSVGAAVGWAAAQIAAGHPAAALATLDSLRASSEAESYQPYWVARGRACAALGQPSPAKEALSRALSMTADDAVRRHLLKGMGPL